MFLQQPARGTVSLHSILAKSLTQVTLKEDKKWWAWWNIYRVRGTFLPTCLSMRDEYSSWTDEWYLPLLRLFSSIIFQSIPTSYHPNPVGKKWQTVYIKQDFQL